MKLKNIKQGMMVKIKSMCRVLQRDSDYEVGDTYEVKEIVHEGVAVFTKDKSDYWYFAPNQLSKINKEST